MEGGFPSLLPRGEHLLASPCDFALPRDLLAFWKLEGELQKTRLTGVRPKEVAMAEFKMISKSEYTPDAHAFLKRKRRIDKDPVCMCKGSKETKTGCGPDCVNRAIQVECSAKDCPVEEIFGPGACQNQRMQRGKRPTLYIEEAVGGRGYGLFTNADISKGALITEYVGEVCTHAECERRLQTVYAQEKHKYLMCVAGGLFIDATRRGNLSRFLNHSCDPNSDFQEWWIKGEPRMGLFAIRDIVKDEEICFDYNFQRIDEDVSQCSCQAKNCRGVLGVAKTAEEAPLVPAVAEPGTDPVLNDKIGVAPDKATMQRFFKLTTARPVISKVDADRARDLCCFLPRNVVAGREEYEEL